MKRLSILLMVFGIVVFTSCTKNDDDNEISIPEFPIDLTRIAVSVDNNVLVFANLDALYECTDYLNEIGEDHYDAFEKAIGFLSYRSFNKKNAYPTQLIATMMNPENKIIVGDKLFEISFSLDSISIFNSHTYFDQCENSNLNPKMKISVHDKVYKTFIENDNLKGACPYCGGNSKKADISGFNTGIKIKIGNYDWVFWNVLEATISKDGWGGSILIGLSTNPFTTSFYRDCNGCSTLKLNPKEGFNTSYTISRSTSPLIAYYFNVDFYVYENAPPAYWADYIGTVYHDSYFNCNIP